MSWGNDVAIAEQKKVMASFLRGVKVQEGLLDIVSLLTIVAHSTSQDLVPTPSPIYRLFQKVSCSRNLRTE